MTSQIKTNTPDNNAGVFCRGVLILDILLFIGVVLTFVLLGVYTLFTLEFWN